VVTFPSAITWGQHLWGRGYFCATVGAVTEEQVKRYIESQDDELSDIQVWDEPKEQDGELQSD
jgi:Transposase IS200 like